MNPLLIAALLSGGGGLINWKIQNDAIAAQNAENDRAMQMERAAREAERARQMSMESLQAEEVTRALMEIDPSKTTGDVTEEVADPGNAFATAAESYNIPSLSGQLTEGGVANSIGKLIADKLQQTRGILKAQSTLSSQGSANQGSRDDLMRMAGVLQNIGSNRRGSLDASRLETSIPAARVTPSDSPIGDLLMLGGQLYGGMGGFGFGGSSPLVAKGTQAMVSPKLAARSIFGAPLTVPSGLPAVY